jgi:DNA repair exonuclease SbcCD ATPase subunit
MNDEFELISVKELKNLKEELIELKKSPKIKSNSNNPKEYVNIFNSISRIENKFEITIKNLNKMMNKLDKIASIFDSDIQTEEEDLNKLNELISRLENLEKSNKDLSEKTENLHNSIKRKSYFNERFPNGLSLKYKRTKTL